MYFLQDVANFKRGRDKKKRRRPSNLDYKSNVNRVQYEKISSPAQERALNARAFKDVVGPSAAMLREIRGTVRLVNEGRKTAQDPTRVLRGYTGAGKDVTSILKGNKQTFFPTETRQKFLRSSKTIIGPEYQTQVLYDYIKV